MFFIASKIFWMLASPINLLLFGALAGLMLCCGRRARFGRALALAAILVLLTAATLPLRGLLIGPLENRFPQPPSDMKPPHGIIVLGGAIDDVTSAARGQTVFDEGGERITEAVILAKRWFGWTGDGCRPLSDGILWHVGVEPTQRRLQAGQKNNILVRNAPGIARAG